LHSFAQQLKLQSGLFSFLADLFAYLLAFLVDLLSALNVNYKIVALKPLDFRYLLILCENFVKLLADGFKLDLNFFSEALTSGSLLAMEGFLKDLAVGANFGLWNILNLFNLIYSLNIHTIWLDGVVGVGLSTYGPGEEGTITTCSIECRPIV